MNYLDDLQQRELCALTIEHYHPQIITLHKDQTCPHTCKLQGCVLCQLSAGSITPAVSGLHWY